MESHRQLVHIGVGVVALSLRWLTWPEAALMAVSAVLLNAFLLPTLLPSVLRTSDRTQRWTSGLVLYPAAVLALVLVFHTRLDLAAIAWVILAAGDGMATLIGAHVRTRRLPWNPEKSLGGLLGFVIAAGLAAAGTALWFAPSSPASWAITYAVVAAVVAAFAETVPMRVDDNITVPVVAAGVLWGATLIDPGVLRTSIMAATWWMVGANVAVAAAGWAARTVTPAGAITGAVIGTAMMVGSGVAGWTVLMATFVLASAATRAGHARKAAAGIAEERGGRRGPGNAIANTGVAMCAAIVAAGSSDPALPWLALVAALATAGSDTVASEVGKAWGRTTLLITTLRRVRPGTSGAVSIEGTVAGLVSAALLAATGATMGLVSWTAVPVVAVAASIASVLEGVLGATLEARGMLTNDVVNCVNSAMGAALALWWWTSF